MKCLLFLLSFSVMLLPAFSQTKLTNSVDSITQSTTAYSTSAKQSNWDYITLQVEYLKGGGAPDFYAIPQGSVDNVGWFDLSKDTAKGANKSTLQTFGWTFDKRRAFYYRIATTASSTTQGFKQTAYIFGGPPPGK